MRSTWAGAYLGVGAVCAGHGSLLVVAWGVCLAVAGCAAMPAPTEALKQAGSAVAQAASDSGVAPEALVLEPAEIKLAMARADMRAKDYRRALWLIQEAEIDAELMQRENEATARRASQVNAKSAALSCTEDLPRANR